MSLDNVLPLLKDVKGSNGQYSARCPAHDDRKASLCISQGKEGRVLIKCQAGCSTEHVVKALGLSMTDLFEEKPKARQAVAVYQYRDAGGKLLGEKLRYADKHFSWRRPAAKGWE